MTDQSITNNYGGSEKDGIDATQVRKRDERVKRETLSSSVEATFNVVPTCALYYTN